MTRTAAISRDPASGPFGFQFACPSCGEPLDADGENAWWCKVENARFPRVSGVWRFIADSKARSVAPLRANYRRLRPGDGRAKAATYRALVGRVIREEQKRAKRRLRIVDLGAGSGWLSSRLSALGHRVAAVDLLASPIGGREHATSDAEAADSATFLAVEASYESLPFASSTVDVAIFNGSLHIARNVEYPLAEALRVLRPGARLVVLDTPIYRHHESGARMVAEREAMFLADPGERGDSFESESFLTMPRLHDLSAKLGVAWRFFTPNYGIKAWTDPWIARLRGRQEPARYRIVTAIAPGKWTRRRPGRASDRS